jgi:hypothetical protein
MGKKGEKNLLPEKYISLQDITLHPIFRFYKGQRSNVNSVFNVLQLEQVVSKVSDFLGLSPRNSTVSYGAPNISWYSSNHFSKTMGWYFNFFKPTGYGMHQKVE